MYLLSPPKTYKETWDAAAIYQIYVLSFRDNNNDGRGDLKGVTEKIPYLRETGFDTILLSSIYVSPMLDFGYDVTDHKNIHRYYGTMSDFEVLVTVVHNSGMKILMDFVPNHTSDQHEWFKKSENKALGYGDYYVWRDPKGHDTSGNPIPPNNWLSVYNGSAWTYSTKRKQFYLHHFLKEQPDLNYRNSKVVQEMNEVLNFWLKKGVDGFRIGCAPFIFEDKNFLDEPVTKLSGREPTEFSYLEHVYTQNQKETFALIQQWRKLIETASSRDGQPRVLIVESYSDISDTMEYYGTAEKPAANCVINFNLLNVHKDSTAVTVKQLINAWLDRVPDFGYTIWVLGNHDQRRVSSRVGVDLIDGMNMLVTILPGITMTYYGEEIGMLNNDEIAVEEMLDTQPFATAIQEHKNKSRDFQRTPFQWDGSPTAGFNDGKKPWLPIEKRYKDINLENQKGKPYSHYTIYTDLLKLRKTTLIRQGETLVQKVGKGSLGVVRSLGVDNFVILVVNFSKVDDYIDLNTHFLIGNRKLRVYTTHPESGFHKGQMVAANKIKLPKKSSAIFVNLESPYE